MMRAEQPKYPKIAAYAIRNEERKSRPGKIVYSTKLFQVNIFRSNTQ